LCSERGKLETPLLTADLLVVAEPDSGVAVNQVSKEAEFVLPMDRSEGSITPLVIESRSFPELNGIFEINRIHPSWLDPKDGLSRSGRPTEKMTPAAARTGFSSRK